MAGRGWSNDVLNSVFDRTDGHCWFCRHPLKWSHYGDRPFAMGWEVDHRVTVANGGSDELSNLVSAC